MTPSQHPTLPFRRASLLTLPCLALGLSITLLPNLFAICVTSAIVLSLLRSLCYWLRPPHSLGAPWNRLIWNWTVAAFLLHVAVGAVILAVPALTSYFGPDAVTYHRGAARLLGTWTGDGLPPDLTSGKEGFYYLLASLYWMVGPYPAVGLIVNAALGAALVPVMTDLTVRLFGERSGRYVPPLLVLVPGLALWPSQLLKEACVLFLIALALASAARLTRRVTLLPLLLLVTVLPLLFTFRAAVALVLAGGLIVAITLGVPRVVLGFSAGLTTLALLGFVILGLGIGYSGFQTTVQTDLAHAHAVRLAYAESARSGFGAAEDISTPQQAISTLPRSVPQFLFGPAPWQIRSTRQLPALAENAVWLLLMPRLWSGLVAARRKVGRAVLLFVLPTLGLLAVLSLVIANFGTLLRERTQITLLLIPLIAHGFAVRRSRRAKAGGTAAPPRVSTAPSVLSGGF